MSYRRFKFPEIANAPATFATVATLQEIQPENRPVVATVATVATPLANTEARTVATVARVHPNSTLSPDDLAYLFEERAAILEFDEGLCREEAEALARVQVYGEGREQ